MDIDSTIIAVISTCYNWLPSSTPNSNFLVFSESFYIERYKNKGCRYYLGKKPKNALSINMKESKTERKKRFNKQMIDNNWTTTKLAKYLGKSRAWISKVLNN